MGPGVTPRQSGSRVHPASEAPSYGQKRDRDDPGRQTKRWQEGQLTLSPAGNCYWADWASVTSFSEACGGEGGHACLCGHVHLRAPEEGALGIHLTWNSHSRRYMRDVVLSCPNSQPAWSQAPSSRMGADPSCHGDTGLTLHSPASLANGGQWQPQQQERNTDLGSEEAHPPLDFLQGQEEGRGVWTSGQARGVLCKCP